jgi:phospholipid/cholesterol/gamma-HCH transport system substrate-binding protein
METRYKFRHVNELTGLFVLGVLALVLAGAVFSGHSQRWFSRKYTFDVLLPEQGASGLRRGDEAFILGVSAGLVDDIRVGDDGRMTARVKIRRDFERFVRVDSTASIKKVFGVAGDSFMEITRGTGTALPSPGPAMPCLVPEDSLDRMERMLADMRSEFVPVVRKAGAAFDEWIVAAGDLQKDGRELRQFIARLDSLAAGVEQGKGTVGRLISDTILADDAQKLLVRMNNLSAGIEAGKGTLGRLISDTGLADEAQKLLERANLAMSGLQDVVTNLNAVAMNVQKGTARLPEITDAVAGEARDLPGLVEQTQTSMRELERLVEALQRHWMLRKYVNKTNPPPMRVSPGVVETPRKPTKPPPPSKLSTR